jgi:hypothetical protein
VAGVLASDRPCPSHLRHIDPRRCIEASLTCRRRACLLRSKARFLGLLRASLRFLAPAPAHRWLEAEVKIEILGFSRFFLLCLVWVILKFETKIKVKMRLKSVVCFYLFIINLQVGF